MFKLGSGIKQERAAVLYVSAMAVVVLVAGIALNAFIVNQIRLNLLSEFGEQELLIAQQVGQKLQDNIAGVRDKLKLVASFPEIQTGNTAICNQKLQELYTTMEAQIGNLGRVGADGKFTCSLNKALIGVPGASLGSYITQIFQDPQHQPVLSRSITVPGVTTRLSALHVPVYNAQKQFIGTVGGAIYFDQLKDKYLQNIHFASSGFVVLFDDNGEVLYHPKASLIGKNINDPELTTSYNASLRAALLSAAHTGKSGQVQYQSQGINKIAAYQSVEVLPGHHWIVTVTVPITAAEDALTTVGLDRAFIALTLVFSLGVIIIAGAMLRTRLKSLEVDRAKDEFLGLATHQLQTPLTGTKMVLSTLLTGASGKLNAEQREFLREAYEACQREHRIVQDLLNVARADSGRMTLKKAPTDLVCLLEAIVKEQEPTIESRGQTVKVTLSSATITADEARLRMAFENLLSNASKYTPEGGHLQLHLVTIGAKVTVTVQDSGVGVAPKDIPKLFNKFGRIPNALSDKVGGTGLGLYLVKQIIELHGGRIRVTSKVGKGSRFIVELPNK